MEYWEFGRPSSFSSLQRLILINILLLFVPMAFTGVCTKEMCDISTGIKDYEALDAKAFQLEQTAAQLTTTGLVLANGLIVASVLVAVFLVFVQLINQTSVW